MPLYLYKCEKCGSKLETIRSIAGEIPLCCDKAMNKLPTTPAMVKWKGAGGYPSNIKAGKGTAPFTSGYSKYGGLKA